MALQLVATKQTDNKQAYTNCAFVSPEDYRSLFSTASAAARVGKSAVRCDIKHFVVNVRADSNMSAGKIGLGHTLRTTCRVGLSEELRVQPWAYSRPIDTLNAAATRLSLSPVLRNQQPLIARDSDLETWCKGWLKDQVLTLNQSVFIEATDINTGSEVVLTGIVIQIEGLDFGVGKEEVNRLQGIVTDDTEFSFEPASSIITVRSSKSKTRNLFKANFNFEQLGIGGLDQEFADIFRRAFASRIYPPHVVQDLGIAHVRGMLLHGPPGTGKTLIARQLGQVLRAKEPKVINGPEVLNKYVGQSEENIRNLFADAEADQKKLGDNSPLHIIIFDELDAICKQRGSNPSGAGVSDSIVNQLLSKIDGVDALNNILLIGMTNRPDMLDEALLRPGRLEVHIEIGLPDESGRKQILLIHTKPMRESGRLSVDVSLDKLAARTKNFSGAEIAGLIRSAVSYAFARNVDPLNLSDVKEEDVKVTMADFENALSEVKPAFGVAEAQLSRHLLNGILRFSPAVEKLEKDLFTVVKQVRDSPQSPLVSVLLWGHAGSGITAMACHIAQNSGFPFVKFVSPADFIGYTELARVAAITKCFEDAYKSDLSLVILDDLERLMDYSAIGPRFSNVMLQALMVLVKRPPKKEGRRILIIATTASPSFVQESGMLDAFQLTYHTHPIKNKESLLAVLGARQQARGDFPESEAIRVADVIFASGTVKMGIKQVYMALEMASELATAKQAIDGRTFMQCLKDYGVDGIIL